MRKDTSIDSFSFSNNSNKFCELCQNDTNRQLLHFSKDIPNQYILITDVTFLKNSRNNSFGKIFNLSVPEEIFIDPTPMGEPHRPPSIILFHHHHSHSPSARFQPHKRIYCGAFRRTSGAEAKENKGGARRRRGGGEQGRAP